MDLASLRDAPAGASFARSSQIRYHALRNVATHAMVPVYEMHLVNNSLPLAFLCKSD